MNQSTLTTNIGLAKSLQSSLRMGATQVEHDQADTLQGVIDSLQTEVTRLAVATTQQKTDEMKRQQQQFTQQEPPSDLLPRGTPIMRNGPRPDEKK